MLLLVLSHLSRVQLCANPQAAAHQASPSLGFSRQEHWSGLPFPSPMHKSEKWKWNCSVVSSSSQPHGLQPTRLLHPWDLPGKSIPHSKICFESESQSGYVFEFISFVSLLSGITVLHCSWLNIWWQWFHTFYFVSYCLCQENKFSFS